MWPYEHPRHNEAHDGGNFKPFEHHRCEKNQAQHDEHNPCGVSDERFGGKQHKGQWRVLAYSLIRLQDYTLQTIRFAAKEQKKWQTKHDF